MLLDSTPTKYALKTSRTVLVHELSLLYIFLKKILNIFQTQVRGTDYKTSDGTCIRDYIDVTDLVDAHVKALEKAKPGHVGIYNVGTGKGKATF